MKIIFTKHILRDKLPLLKKNNFIITKNDIKIIIKHPDHTDTKSDKPKIIVSKDFDKKHLLRVVYKVDDDIIKVITVYPAEKGRYY